MAAELSEVHLPRYTVKHFKVLFEIANPNLQGIFTLTTTVFPKNNDFSSFLVAIWFFLLYYNSFFLPRRCTVFRDRSLVFLHC